MTARPSIKLVPYEEALQRYDPVMGLEVHVELNTASKMFCGCSTAFGAEPNTQTCPVCLGLPGSLPVVNAVAVESAIRIGLALNCSIAEWCRFARKNYFYPDMPKNYQISQYDEPIAYEGQVEIEVEGRDVRRSGSSAPTWRRTPASRCTSAARRAGSTAPTTRCSTTTGPGVPLIEIVTKPIEGAGDKTPIVARAYVAMLRDLLRALGVSDVRMEQGSLRCDANLSLRPNGQTEFGTRSETKNVNSLRSVERAMRYEVTRQAALLDAGERVVQETRHWHEDTGVTTSGRSKETAEDYRYFPEPDLVPIAPSREWVEELRGTLPEPPAERLQRITAEWGFSDLELRDVISAGARGPDRADRGSRGLAAGRSEVVADRTVPARRRSRGRAGRTRHQPGPGRRGSGAGRRAGTVNDKMARQVFEGVLAGEGTPAEVVARPRAGRGVRRGGPRGSRRRGDRRPARCRRQDQSREGAGRRGADRRGDEGDARPGRRGPGA